MDSIRIVQLLLVGEVSFTHHPPQQHRQPSSQRATEQPRTAATSAKQQPPSPITMTFTSSTGRKTYMTVSKRPITDTAERGGVKQGQFKKNVQIISLRSLVNSDGDLRIQCERGWVTAALAGGQQLLRPIDDGAVEHRQQPVKKAFGERKANSLNVPQHNPSTPNKTPAPATAPATPTAPSAMQIGALISTLSMNNPDWNVKKIAKLAKEEQPTWKIGCKEVRDFQASSTEFRIASTPSRLLSPAPRAWTQTSSPWKQVA